MLNPPETTTFSQIFLKTLLYYPDISISVRARARCRCEPVKSCHSTKGLYESLACGEDPQDCHYTGKLSHSQCSRDISSKETPNKHSSTTTVLKAACSFFGAKEMMKCVSFTFSKKPHVEVCLGTTLTPIMSGQLRRPLSTSFQASDALKRPDSFGNIFPIAACFGIHLKRKC